MEVGTDFSRIIGETIEKIQDTMADKTAEENTETTIIGMIEVGIGLEKGCFSGAMTTTKLGV